MEERKKAEEHQKTRMLLQKVFDGISDPLIMIDGAGAVKMMNKAAGKYYGFPGNGIPEGKTCYESLRGRMCPCERCERPFSSIRGYTGVFERNDPQGRGALEQIAVYCVRDEDGAEDGAIIRISDVTQARLLERQIIQNEKLASVGLLAAGLAHEINNPNSFITFNIPILRDYLQELMPVVHEHAEARDDFELFGMSVPEFEKDVFKLLDNMEHGSHRISATVSRLTDFVRKRETKELKTIDPGCMAKRALEFCRPEIAKRVKTLHAVIPDGLPPICTDPEAIEQILVNLLINAAQASDKADSWIRLSVGPGGSDGETCIIEVSDNGRGMDDAVKRKIFDPFFTTKSSIQGAGLGLYVCYYLVMELGGRIDVHSQPGKGTSFKITLYETEKTLLFDTP